MNFVRINEGNVGVVFKRKNFDRVITKGTYFLGYNEKVLVFDMAKQFLPNFDMNILLKDENLVSLLHVIEVADNELVLMYESGNFKNVLNAGRYLFWKGLVPYEFQKVKLSQVQPIEGIQLNLLTRYDLNQYIRVFKVESFEKGILVVDGKNVGKIETGVYYFWLNPTPINILKVDIRQQQLEISGQEILTKDKTNVRMNFFASYKVVDIEKALLENKDFERQLYIVLQLALREFTGSLTLDELLERKELVAENVSRIVQLKAERLGVEVIDCGVRDIILPGDIKEIMNQVLIAEKKAQANIITRREETASTRALLNTAKLMEENSMLLKLKEMEYVEKIADKINNITISGNSQVLDQLKTIFTRT